MDKLLKVGIISSIASLILRHLSGLNFFWLFKPGMETWQYTVLLINWGLSLTAIVMICAFIIKRHIISRWPEGRCL